MPARPMPRGRGRGWLRLTAPQYFQILFPAALLPAMRMVMARKRSGDDGKPFRVVRATFRRLWRAPTGADGAHLVALEDAREVAVDMPGMCVSGRPWTTVRAAGCRLSVPCDDVGAAIGRIRGAERVRRFGTAWHEAPFFHRSLVMRPADRRAVLAALVAARPAAERRAAAFWRRYDAAHPVGADLLSKARAGTHAIGPEGPVPL